MRMEVARYLYIFEKSHFESMSNIWPKIIGCKLAIIKRYDEINKIFLYLIKVSNFLKIPLERFLCGVIQYLIFGEVYEI